MVEGDIDHVQEIEARSFRTRWSPTTYRRELRHSNSSRYVVARASQTPPPPHPQQQSSESSRRRNGLWQLLFAPFLAPTPAASQHPLVGYGGVWINLDEGHITTIAVDPHCRGRSIGELLLNALIDQAIELGAANLTLEVRVSNVVAQSLYRKYGFEVAGRRKRYYTDDGEDALIMWTEKLGSAAYQANLRTLRQDLFARLRTHAEAAAGESGDESPLAYSS